MSGSLNTATPFCDRLQGRREGTQNNDIDIINCMTCYTASAVLYIAIPYRYYYTYSICPYSLACRFRVYISEHKGTIIRIDFSLYHNNVLADK